MEKVSQARLVLNITIDHVAPLPKDKKNAYYLIEGSSARAKIRSKLEKLLSGAAPVLVMGLVTMSIIKETWKEKNTNNDLSKTKLWVKIKTKF